MANHQQILKDIYPSPERLRALLPRGDARYRMDLSRYGVTCEGYIGAGLMSTVYRVRKDGKVYACKVTSLRYTNEGAPSAANIAERTLQEIKLTKTLLRSGVRGIMPLKEYLPGENTIREYIRKARNLSPNKIPSDWVILELMPLGLPYSSFMEYFFKSGKRLTEAEWAALMLDLVQPVQFMHERCGIIHRDLKPGNIMLILLDNGQVRAAVADFNVSKAFAGEIDQDYTKVGTGPYEDPRIKDKTSVSRRDAESSDLFAIAQIGYQFLNQNQAAPCRGQIPAPKNTPSSRVTELLRAMLSNDIRSIPSCTYVINELRGMVNHTHDRPIQKYHTPALPQHHSPKQQYHPAKRKPGHSSGQKKVQKQKGGYTSPAFGQMMSMTSLFDEPFFQFPEIKF